MLSLLLPVMLEQTDELRVQLLVRLDAFEVMALRQPLEMQDQDRDGELRIGEYRPGDGGSRPDELDRCAEALLEFLREALE
ncbi:MAG: hypothetical protein QM661_09495 [Solimonas sp.]